jgi:hypothetical protein
MLRKRAPPAGLDPATGFEGRMYAGTVRNLHVGATVGQHLMNQKWRARQGLEPATPGLEGPSSVTFKKWPHFQDSYPPIGYDIAVIFCESFWSRLLPI